ncbi:MAG: purine-nucleoside phosphorylase [Acidobacteriota bacterium]
MLQHIDEAVSFIRTRTRVEPRVVIILGSGLGSVADSIEADVSIPYSEIPHSTGSAVAGHAGRLIAGSFETVPLLVMQGRVHFYEGHTMDSVTFLARVAGRMGVKAAVVTNAAGGVNTSFKPGDLMLISDHINMLGTNPLRGPNDEQLGPRFPDMSTVYPEHLRALARRVATENSLAIQEGVYLALSGPTYETPAEVRALRVLGADATGMSTVPEATVFAQMGIDVLGISCITNMAAGVLPEKLRHEEVLETTTRVRKEFTRLVLGVVAKL